MARARLTLALSILIVTAASVAAAPWPPDPTAAPPPAKVVKVVKAAKAVAPASPQAEPWSWGRPAVSSAPAATAAPPPAPPPAPAAPAAAPVGRKALVAKPAPVARPRPAPATTPTAPVAVAAAAEGAGPVAHVALDWDLPTASLSPGEVSTPVSEAAPPAAMAAPRSAAATVTPASAVPPGPRVAVTAPTKGAIAVPTGLKRWVEVSTASLGLRYRTVTDSKDVRGTNQMQENQGVRFRVRLDPAGRYSVHAGLATGGAMTSGWNTTGVGTGDNVTKVFVKQLYFSAAPMSGVELQYGGLGFARGENTEITSYDNDAYLMGARASVKRRQSLFFDEISATQGYVGDLSTPSVFARADRLDELNYWQLLAARRIGAFVTASTDVTRVAGVRWLRGAVTFKPAHAMPVDLVRLETYRRFATDKVAGATGFAAYAERTLAKRLTAGGGWADIDPRYGGLNADRFNKGRRLFASSTVTLTPEFSLQAFYTFAARNDFSVANKTRLDLILTYNLLKTLQKAGVF